MQPHTWRARAHSHAHVSLCQRGRFYIALFSRYKFQQKNITCVLHPWSTRCWKIKDEEIYSQYLWKLKETSRFFFIDNLSLSLSMYYVIRYRIVQPRHSSSPRRRRPSLTAGMAICNFRDDSEPRGASRCERERAKDATCSLLLRPFVLSGKRAMRIDYVPDWRLDGAIMVRLSLRELRFEMLVKYRRNRRPTRAVRFSFLLPLAMKSHLVDRKSFFFFFYRSVSCAA